MCCHNITCKNDSFLTVVCIRRLQFHVDIKSPVWVVYFLANDAVLFIFLSFCPCERTSVFSHVNNEWHSWLLRKQTCIKIRAFFSLKKCQVVWKHFEQDSQWFGTTAQREEYIFSVCVVGNLFTGRVTHAVHMLLHVQSLSESQKD